MTKGKNQKVLSKGGKGEGSNAPQKFISERKNKKGSATSHDAPSTVENDERFELETVTTRELSELVNLSTRSILDFAQRGIIQRLAKDTYPLLDSVRTIVKRERARLEDALNVSDDNLRFLKAKADLAELAYAQELELYASVEDLDYVQSRMLEHIQQSLMNAVPDIARKAVSAAHDENALNECLTQSIRTALVDCASVDIDQLFARG